MTRATRAHLAAAAAILVAALAGAAAQDPSSDESARNQYKAAVSFMREGKFESAMQDFHSLALNYPQSRYADDALLQVATYELEIGGNLKEAEAAIERIVKRYNASDSLPLALVLTGRVRLARARTAAEIEATRVEYERVVRRFPDEEAVAAALYHDGESLRVLGKQAEALTRFQRAGLEYSRSTWSARAGLSTAVCLVQLGQPVAGLRELQRVRLRFPGSPQAATALDRTTLLARLYVRRPPQPAYVFSQRVFGNRGQKLTGIVGIGVDRSDGVVVASRESVTWFRPDGSVRSSLQLPATALGMDGWRRTLVASAATLRVGEDRQLPLLIPKPRKNVSQNAPPRRKADEFDQVSEPIAVVGTTAEFLVADGDREHLLRFTLDGTYSGRVPDAHVDRIVADDLGRFVSLDRRAREIQRLDREGTPFARISRRGAGYEMGDPKDVAVDVFGHVYVLDADPAQVLVFGPDNSLIATFSIPEKAEGAFRDPSALVIDAAGRLLIRDERQRAVLVYE